VGRRRAAYGHLSERRERQFVFAGTINGTKYLHDWTGNRRIWPLTTGKVDLQWVTDNRDQLWAEASTREREGASIVLPERLWAIAERIQRSRMAPNTWIEALTKLKPPANASAHFFTTDLMIDHLGIPPERHNQHHWDKLKDAMGTCIRKPPQARV
jgi:hypothetical protein